jgi:tetratricopeptide (TPR) repeat protein
VQGPLYGLLEDCSPRILVGKAHGTGFFVAPGQILSCAHVVETAVTASRQIVVTYGGRDYPAEIADYRADPYPDLALLRIGLTDHPRAHLDPAAEPGDLLFVYGYTSSYVGGVSTTAEYEGPVWRDRAKNDPLLKFKQGQIIPGLSGAALLNVRTGAVCGVVKSSRHVATDLGGNAVPIGVAIDLFGLPHAADSRWQAAVQSQRTRSQAAVRPLADLRLYRSENRDRPEHLVGRESLIAAIDPLLDNGRHVLLCGGAGNGKSALAATIADRRADSGKQYLWIRTGQEGHEAVFETLIAELADSDRQGEIRGSTGGQRQAAVAGLLAASGATLLVLDDVWNGGALRAILDTVPRGMAVLVTSRTRFTVRHLVEVGELTPDAAISLLTVQSGQEYEHDAQASALCRELGYHPYAIEIAGSYLRELSTPEELREQIAGAPHDLPMPAEFATEGRESVKRLLDLSYGRLSDSDSRSVLRAFGAFATPGATADLLATYLDEPLVRVRTALAPLISLSFVKRVDKSPFYDIHDLTYSYARALSADRGEDRRRVVRAAARFVTDHIREYELLALDMANILGAAGDGRADEVDAFLSIVSDLATGGYMDDRGHTAAFLTMLDAAIAVAKERAPADRDMLVHRLVGRRGDAYYDRGELDQALERYREALDLAPDDNRRAILLGVIGRTLGKQGDHEAADALFTEAYAVAEANHDNRALVRVLEQHGFVAALRKDYRTVRDLALRGVEVSRQLGDRGLEGLLLNNLGSAELDLGVATALAYHRDAHHIAVERQDDALLALTHQSLGLDLHAGEDFAAAKTHLLEALRLYGKVGHTESERAVENMVRQFGYLR